MQISETHFDKTDICSHLEKESQNDCILFTNCFTANLRQNITFLNEQHSWQLQH